MGKSQREIELEKELQEYRSLVESLTAEKSENESNGRYKREGVVKEVEEVRDEVEIMKVARKRVPQGRNPMKTQKINQQMKRDSIVKTEFTTT